jgi:hypothetical protein
MAEPAISFVQPTAPLAGAAEPLPRCCPSHADWATLSQHLLLEFPDVAIEGVVREVRHAKEAVDRVSLRGEEAVQIGELIARQQLLMRSGRVAEVARLDPERHTQRT